eukprot:scaffold1882_cov384-Prasinococcus_capsulatus_cf.AAC.8
MSVRSDLAAHQRFTQELARQLPCLKSCYKCGSRDNDVYHLLGAGLSGLLSRTTRTTLGLAAARASVHHGEVSAECHG